MQRSLQFDRLRFGLGGHQYRRDADTVACVMEILHVERVVPYLVKRRNIELRLAGFEFENEEHVPDDKNHISPPTQPRNGVFEVDFGGRVFFFRKLQFLKDFDLFLPCVVLREVEVSACKAGHLTQNLVATLLDKVFERRAV